MCQVSAPGGQISEGARCKAGKQFENGALSAINSTTASPKVSMCVFKTVVQLLASKSETLDIRTKDNAVPEDENLEIDQMAKKLLEVMMNNTLLTTMRQTPTTIAKSSQSSRP